MKNSYFSRETTGALKGIALILMFVHHFFTFPGWITCGVEYPWIQEFTNQFCAPTDICVCLFAFLTGYLFFFSPGTLRYGLRKITDFLLSYWLVAVPMIAAAALLGCFTLSRNGVLAELLGVRNQVMSFCWYVYFYCIIMVLLTLLTRRESSSPVLDALFLLIVPTVLLSAWEPREFRDIPHAVAWNLRQWYPCVAVGWLFAKYSLFEKWFDGFWGATEKSGIVQQVFLPVVLLWIAFRGRYYISYLVAGDVTFRGSDYPVRLTTDILNAPIFLFAGAKLLNLHPGNLATRVLRKIGDKSMLMWFFHCLFFNCMESYTQWLLYLPRNPILVLVWGLAMCWLLAYSVEPVRKFLIDLKHRLFCKFSDFRKS